MQTWMRNAKPNFASLGTHYTTGKALTWRETQAFVATMTTIFTVEERKAFSAEFKNLGATTKPPVGEKPACTCNTTTKFHTFDCDLGRWLLANGG